MFSSKNRHRSFVFSSPATRGSCVRTTSFLTIGGTLIQAVRGREGVCLFVPLPPHVYCFCFCIQRTHTAVVPAPSEKKKRIVGPSLFFFFFFLFHFFHPVYYPRPTLLLPPYSNLNPGLRSGRFFPLPTTHSARALQFFFYIPRNLKADILVGLAVSWLTTSRQLQ